MKLLQDCLRSMELILGQFFLQVHNLQRKEKVSMGKLNQGRQTLLSVLMPLFRKKLYIIILLLSLQMNSIDLVLIREKLYLKKVIIPIFL